MAWCHQAACHYMNHDPCHQMALLGNNHHNTNNGIADWLKTLKHHLEKSECTTFVLKLYIFSTFLGPKDPAKTLSLLSPRASMRRYLNEDICFGDIKGVVSHLVSRDENTKIDTVQWNLYKTTTELCGLSIQVVFHDRENKHDFVKTMPGKW